MYRDSFHRYIYIDQKYDQTNYSRIIKIRVGQFSWIASILKVRGDANFVYYLIPTKGNMILLT